MEKNKLNFTALLLTLDFTAKILKLERNWQRRKISRASVKLTPATFYSGKSANNIIIAMNSCTFGLSRVSIPRELFSNSWKVISDDKKLYTFHVCSIKRNKSLTSLQLFENNRSAIITNTEINYLGYIHIDREVAMRKMVPKKE